MGGKMDYVENLTCMCMRSEGSEACLVDSTIRTRHHVRCLPNVLGHSRSTCAEYSLREPLMME